jgi:Family of unknown function (DUF5703)
MSGRCGLVVQLPITQAVLVFIPSGEGHNRGMANDDAGDVEADWEYAPLRIPSDVSRVTAAVRLSLHAEYGGWELARVRKYTDGTRQILLRRRKRPTDAVPLPGLIA